MLGFGGVFAVVFGFAGFENEFAVGFVGFEGSVSAVQDIKAGFAAGHFVFVGRDDDVDVGFAAVFQDASKKVFEVYYIINAEARIDGVQENPELLGAAVRPLEVTDFAGKVANIEHDIFAFAGAHGCASKGIVLIENCFATGVGASVVEVVEG